MIALAIILVILTYSQLWDPVECGCSYPQCGSAIRDTLKTRIKHNGRLMTCSYLPEPYYYCPCHRIEDDRAPCWFMNDARAGQCFKGECYDRLDYESAKKGQRLNTNLPCEVPSDYMYEKRRGTQWPYGCKYYCRSSPHLIVNHPDGSHCLNPTTAPPGKCHNGYCKKI
ncbi:uncharacterized protein LOC135376111 [Ornithodoros turicata]|uniref:uncharacterized protein LOC135376111 n=1 Tax=Ornithodoros turicata TaxID=34597 RepID=UPI003138F1B4